MPPQADPTPFPAELADDDTRAEYAAETYSHRDALDETV